MKLRDSRSFKPLRASFLSYKGLKLLWVLLLLGALLTVRPVSAAAHLVVSPQGPYRTIEEALRVAQDGDFIEVYGGTYHGNLVIDKAVTLAAAQTTEGERPVLDAGGVGTVVKVNAPHVTVRGFEIRNSGSEPDQDHAGITVNAPFAVVEQNRLDEVLFGIFVAQAADSVVRDNEITSQARFETGRKGDAIRLWYSPRVLVENNHVYQARDLVLWYSEGVHLVNNLIEDGRYGVHLMYCDNSLIENNRLLNNSVGIYAMYSRQVELRNNDLRGQRGPSGYALGFKDTDAVLAQANLLIDNRGGIFLDGTPFTPNSFARFENNIIAFNDIAVTIMPAVKGVEFSNNVFWENVEQMAVHGGGGKPTANMWQGNYWSDYDGFDADGDGVGDTPYISEKFFENMTDREPLLRALLYSPSAQAIEFAAASFPIVKPQPKFSDPQPQVNLPALPIESTRRSAGGMILTAAFLLALACGAFFIAYREKTMENKPAAPRDAEPVSPTQVSVRNVTKSYGKTTVLQDLSFELGAGRALALWGANGAGKTTLIQAMLGLVPFEGTIVIADQPVKSKGKQVRGRIGYVPQQVMFYDWSVQSTLQFYARLKRVSAARIETLVEQMGLTTHRAKAVSALSGGLKQRLALALALLSDPPVLLLDEPTANLDTQARADYVKLVGDLKQQDKTIVFASHRLEEVEALADEILWLDSDKSPRHLNLEEWRAQVAPMVELTLWLANGQRERANDFLHAAGWQSHLNGHGTIVIRTRAEQKLKALRTLASNGFIVDDFQVERQSEVE